MISISLPPIISFFEPELMLVDSRCLVDYDGVRYSECDIELTFNLEVRSGSAYISFYDENENLLVTKDVWFFDDGKVVNKTVSYIPGNVKFFEVNSFNFYTPLNFFDYLDAFYYLQLIIFIFFFVEALLISYKEYEYKGRKISVYSGFYHHTLRIDGEIYDEHNTIATFTPIKLSCTTEEGDIVSATISITYRISLKINNKLYTVMSKKRK